MLNRYTRFIDQDKEHLKNVNTINSSFHFEALDNEDTSEIYRIIQTIFALRSAVVDKGEKSVLLSGIIENISSIKEGIQNSLCNNQKLDEKTSSEVFEIKSLLNKSLTVESMTLTEAIQKSKTIEDIIYVRTNNNFIARTLVGQIDTNESKAIKHITTLTCIFLHSMDSLLQQQHQDHSSVSIFHCSIHLFLHWNTCSHQKVHVRRSTCVCSVMLLITWAMLQMSYLLDSTVNHFHHSNNISSSSYLQISTVLTQLQKYPNHSPSFIVNRNQSPKRTSMTS